MNHYTHWFSRALWAGIVLDWVLGVPGIFLPNATLSFFGQREAPDDPLWIAFACLCLVLLSLFYVPGAINPTRYRANAWLAVLARPPGIVFFLWGYPGLYPTFGILDSVLFVVQAPLLILMIRSGSETSERTLLNGEKELKQS